MNRVLVVLLLMSLGTLAFAERGMVAVEQPWPAPDFELPDPGGHNHRLIDYRGKYLFVNFWAVWCSPCRKEMPSMQQAYDRLRGEGLEMVAIHVGPSAEGARRFADELGLTFGILVDEEMALTSWQVQGLPTTYLIDPDGKIVAEAVGERDWNSAAVLEQLSGLISAH